MTSPADQPPFAPPSAPPQPSPYATSQPSPYPPQPSPYAAQLPYGPLPPAPAPVYGVPHAQTPHGGSTRTLSVVALIAAIIAVVLALGTLFVVVMGSGAFDSGYTLIGTAPQVVDGQPYSGAMLAKEVKRVIEDDGATVSAVDCPDTPRVDSDAVTACTGTVDDWKERITVDFQDGEGHFTLDEQDAE